MFDSAVRLNVALKGRYRIERELGEGGMATLQLSAGRLMMWSLRDWFSSPFGGHTC